jgi:hypothetical protein
VIFRKRREHGQLAPHPSIVADDILQRSDINLIVQASGEARE